MKKKTPALGSKTGWGKKSFHSQSAFGQTKKPRLPVLMYCTFYGR
jgi:hypothetical protein